ncbi:MAG: S26 family signal peptidase [Rhodopila sp.]|nr:S26 family signal peptidase [Rhodopila sp.]
MSTRLSRRLALGGILVGVTLLAASAAIGAHPLLIWNATASAPIGFYRVLPAGDEPLRVGDLVVVRPDTASAKLYGQRGYLPLGVPLLKRIAATAGQLVCEHNGVVSIDGRHVADVLTMDGSGRPLAAWNGCCRLGDQEIFLLMADVPASLDGRYFGPTPTASVIGRAIPLWTPGAR